VLYKYGLDQNCLPVYAPEGVEKTLEGLVGEWTDTFDWKLVTDGDTVSIDGTQLAFSRTDHPLPTVAVELAHGDKRLVYTADTGPGWSVEQFAPGADLVLSEATYQHDDIRAPIHLSARQAGEAARAAQARRLMLTHLWPTLDPVASVEEGSNAFGHAVTLAAPHLVTHI
jgi:ribonuclease BN (tRNA processing enzyme)